MRFLSKLLDRHTAVALRPVAEGMARYRGRRGTGRGIPLFCLAWAVGTTLLSPQFLIATTEYTDDDVYSAFILNILKFTQFSQEKADIDLRVMVFGPQGLTSRMTSLLSGQVVGTRRIVIEAESPDSSTIPDVVVISGLSEAATERVLSRFISKHPLTLGDSDQFLSLGGAIYFGAINGRIHFKVNQTALRASEVKISSRVLTLADEVLG